MSEQEQKQDSDRTALTREELETSKERAITFREWGYFVITCLVGAMLISALWSWKKAQNMGGAFAAKESARLDAELERLDAVLEHLDETTAKGPALVQAATDGLNSIKTIGDDLHREIPGTFRRVNASVDQLPPLLTSLQGVAREGQLQLKQNGDAAHDVLVSFNTFVKDTNTKATKLFEDGSLLIETLNAKTAKVLDDFDVIEVGPDGLQGLVAKGNYVMAEAGGITRNVDLLTRDIQEKEHSLLFAPPCHGLGCALKKYILRPIQTYGGAAYLVERLIYNLP